jgi:hypothetical protein
MLKLESHRPEWAETIPKTTVGTLASALVNLCEYVRLVDAADIDGVTVKVAKP